MSDDLYDLHGLAASLQAALDEELAPGGAETRAPAVELSLPARPEYGDLTTNLALIAAKRAGRVPRELAEAVGARWLAGPGAGVCDRFEVAGPGFLNLFLTDVWYRRALDRLLAEGGDYGRGALPPAQRQKMNIEFVSVNPTGPLHVGHARYASYGDALCRILAFVGHDITREFYVNDYGTQMLRFGQSLAARYGQRLGLDAPVPEEGYQGDYVLELADELDRRRGRPLQGGARSCRPGRHRAAGRGDRCVQGLGTRRDPGAVPRDARAPAQCRSTCGRRRARFTKATASTAASAARWARRSPTSTARASSTTRAGRCGSRRPGTATTRTGSSSARPATPPISSLTSPTTATRWTVGSST